MLSTYPACFFKEKGGYSVSFPDLNNLSASGKSLDEALAMAIDCLAGYLYTCQMDGTDVAGPSVLEELNPRAVAATLRLEPEECFTNLVAVDVKEYAKTHFEKAVKKTLTIPAWLNNAALAQNINFSQVLQEALKERIYKG